MKKYLIATAAMALAGNAGAFVNGFYGAVDAGFGQTSGINTTVTEAGRSDLNAHANLNGAAGPVAALNAAQYNGVFNFAKKSKTSGVFGLSFGFAKVVGSCMLMDTFFRASYDTASVDLARDGATFGRGPVSVKYKPGFALGLGARFGRMFTETLAGLIGVAVDYNFAKTKISYTGGTAGQQTALNMFNKKFGVWSLTPHATLRGALNDKVHWLATVGYKFTLKAGLKDTSTFKFTKKPTQWTASLGLAYNM